MNVDEKRKSLDEMTRLIIGSAQRVSRVLGSGFLEKVYENALMIELKRSGLRAQSQAPLQVKYENEVVGEYIADILVEKQILVELKAVISLDNVHQAQCMNYLKASQLTVCLLINFGQPKIEIKRIVNGF
jgi:GxxExxY protein